MKTLPATIHEMLNSREWDMFISDKLGNDLFLSDPDRADRIHKAAEDGCDGSTHSEHIEDQREFLDALKDEADRETWNMEDEAAAQKREEEIATWHAKLTAELDSIEKWHEQNGSLHQEVG